MFEEHEAALIYDCVEAWIRVYAGIADFLDKSKPSALVEILQRYVDGLRYQAEKFLADIGPHDLVAFHKPQF